MGSGPRVCPLGAEDRGPDWRLALGVFIVWIRLTSTRQVRWVREVQIEQRRDLIQTLGDVQMRRKPKRELEMPGEWREPREGVAEAQEHSRVLRSERQGRKLNIRLCKPVVSEPLGKLLQAQTGGQKPQRSGINKDRVRKRVTRWQSVASKEGSQNARSQTLSKYFRGLVSSLVCACVHTQWDVTLEYTWF